MKLSLNILLFAGLAALMNAQHFDYKDQAAWYELNDAQCRFDRQSPIELNSIEALPNYSFSSLKLQNFEIPLSSPAVLWNNGHSANIQFSSVSKAFVTGGPLRWSNYITQSLHFHWGSKDFHGCEHVIDGNRCSMEMHIVNRNIKYATVEEASKYVDGLCVLAVTFNVDPYQQEDFSGLNSIVDALPQIVEYNNYVELNNLVLIDLLGRINTGKFFSYDGSLTTPPCSQAVTWIVFQQSIPISRRQITQFRMLTDINGYSLVNNYRDLQAKGNRLVLLHFNNLKE